MKVKAFMYKGKCAVISYKNLVYTLKYNDIQTKHLSKEGCMKFLGEKYDGNLSNSVS